MTLGKWFDFRTSTASVDAAANDNSWCACVSAIEQIESETLRSGQMVSFKFVEDERTVKRFATRLDLTHGLPLPRMYWGGCFCEPDMPIGRVR